MQWALGFLALLYIAMLVILLAGCAKEPSRTDYLDLAMTGSEGQLMNINQGGK